jgi:hypothetical protein
VRLPRTMTRRERVAVAVFGIFVGVLILIALGLLICKRRSDHFKWLADECEAMEQSCTWSAAQVEQEARDVADRLDNVPDRIFNVKANRVSAERLRANAEEILSKARLWRDLKKKFRRAANRPWEAGPPEPVNIGKRGSGNWRR